MGKSGYDAILLSLEGMETLKSGEATSSKRGTQKQEADGDACMHDDAKERLVGIAKKRNDGRSAARATRQMRR